MLDSGTITVSPFAGTADICPPGELPGSSGPLWVSLTGHYKRVLILMSQVSFSNTALELSPANMAVMIRTAPGAETGWSEAPDVRMWSYIYGDVHSSSHTSPACM